MILNATTHTASAHATDPAPRTKNQGRRQSDRTTARMSEVITAAYPECRGGPALSDERDRSEITRHLTRVPPPGLLSRSMSSLVASPRPAVTIDVVWSHPPGLLSRSISSLVGAGRDRPRRMHPHHRPISCRDPLPRSRLRIIQPHSAMPEPGLP